jgi:hypothetical protein
MTGNEDTAVIHRPEIRCSLTVDELAAAVDKVIDTLPDDLGDEWLAQLADAIGYPSIFAEDEEAFRHAFWQAARVTVARFADGEITRLSTFHSGDKLNLSRGVRLARAAYESRTRKAPPAIIEAYYERDGEVLERYDAEVLGVVP